MKYYKNIIEPKDVNLNSWVKQKINNFTFILPINNNITDKDYNITYHKNNLENIIIISPNFVATHTQQLNLLFNHLKLPKETKYLDCLLGINFKSEKEILWGKTIPPEPKLGNFGVSSKQYLLENKIKPTEKLMMKYIEKIHNNYIDTIKKQKNNKEIIINIKEILPKIKKRKIQIKKKTLPKIKIIKRR